LKHKNVAAELLSKLLRGEIKKGSKKNVVVSRTFAELLQRTLNAYHNRAIATQEVIEELIRMAKDYQKASSEGEELGLDENEAALRLPQFDGHGLSPKKGLNHDQEEGSRGSAPAV